MTFIHVMEGGRMAGAWAYLRVNEPSHTVVARLPELAGNDGARLVLKSAAGRPAGRRDPVRGSLAERPSLGRRRAARDAALLLGDRAARVRPLPRFALELLRLATTAAGPNRCGSGRGGA